MADALDRFLVLLEAGPADPSGVFNPWRDFDDRDRAPRRSTPRQRLDNLSAYLDARRRSARCMLMGEAPSHRGCRFSGIAFCSEHELVHKADLVARRPLALTSRDADVKPFKERSAHVIWDEIAHAGAAYDVMLWNTFPWHPHGDTVTSNRKPRLTEVAHGRAALAALLECFTHKLEILAVGKVAEDALSKWPEVTCAGYIRHPAQGGEARIRQALVFQSLSFRAAGGGHRAVGAPVGRARLRPRKRQRASLHSRSIAHDLFHSPRASRYGFARSRLPISFFKSAETRCFAR